MTNTNWGDPEQEPPRRDTYPEQQVPGQQYQEFRHDPQQEQYPAGQFQDRPYQDQPFQQEQLQDQQFHEEPQQGQFPPEQFPPEDSSRKRRPWVWVVVILAIALVIAVVGGFFLINNTKTTADTVFNFDSQQRGPQSTESSGIQIPVVGDPAETVREYLSYIEAGDATNAGAFVDPGAPLASGDALAVDALASALSRPSVVAVELVDQGEGTASVRATMSLDGEQFEHVFALELIETTVDGSPEKTWSIDAPLVAPIEVSTSGMPSVLVGDVEVGVDATTGTQRIYLYPGTYEVSADAGEYFTVSGSNQTLRVTAPSADPETASFSASPNQAFEDAVLAQVQERVDLCTQVPGNMDDECPSITRNTKLEVLTVTQQPSGFDSLSSTSFISSRGEIGVIDSSTSSNPNPSERTSKFNVYGDIEIVDGYPQISNVRAY
ncbi:hypothetical protein [Gulosibacter molinativorax]|uniref:Cyclic nucleotide-binding domain-containing protein n=1 Tax=Gulosibacter molinativorax TaxID=256821 RepID=A0ABT7CA76_9MICO|nr:hypothetical protein [Gulosibacter molinativorax]MDJ1372093.1 hypothetical protein [Gulosibacter molinativorax]QUY62364.1 Hypotetical protein [Gulosibacter molinativorax]